MYPKLITIFLLGVLIAQVCPRTLEDSSSWYDKHEKTNEDYDRLSYQVDNNKINSFDNIRNRFSVKNLGENESNLKAQQGKISRSEAIIFPTEFVPVEELTDSTEDENTNEIASSENKNTENDKITEAIKKIFTNAVLTPILVNRPIIFPTDERYIKLKSETKSVDSDSESVTSTEKNKNSLTNTNTFINSLLNDLFVNKKQTTNIDRTVESNEIDKKISLETLLNQIFTSKPVSTETENSEESIDKFNSVETKENDADNENEQNADFNRILKTIFEPLGTVDDSTEQNKQMFNEDYTKELMEKIFHLTDDDVESKDIANDNINKIMQIIFAPLDESEPVKRDDESNESGIRSKGLSDEDIDRIMNTIFEPSQRKVRASNEVKDNNEDDDSHLQSKIQESTEDNNNDKQNMFENFDEMMKTIFDPSDEKIQESNELNNNDKQTQDEDIDQMMKTIFAPTDDSYLNEIIQEPTEDNNTDKQNMYENFDEMMKTIFDPSDEKIQESNELNNNDKQTQDEDIDQMMKTIFAPTDDSYLNKIIQEPTEDNITDKQNMNEHFEEMMKTVFGASDEKIQESNEFNNNDKQISDEYIDQMMKSIFAPTDDSYSNEQIQVSNKDNNNNKRNTNEDFEDMWKTIFSPLDEKIQESIEFNNNNKPISDEYIDQMMKSIFAPTDESYSNEKIQESTEVNINNKRSKDENFEQMMNEIFGSSHVYRESTEDGNENKQQSKENTEKMLDGILFGPFDSSDILKKFASNADNVNDKDVYNENADLLMEILLSPLDERFNISNEDDYRNKLFTYKDLEQIWNITFLPLQKVNESKETKEINEESDEEQSKKQTEEKVEENEIENEWKMENEKENEVENTVIDVDEVDDVDEETITEGITDQNQFPDYIYSTDLGDMEDKNTFTENERQDLVKQKGKYFVTLTKTDVDDIMHINDFVHKYVMNSMGEAFNMADEEVKLILNNRVKQLPDDSINDIEIR